MKITTVGIDLAKNVFQVHGIDERGKAVLRKQLRRAQVAVFFGNLPPCVIGMEACDIRDRRLWVTNTRRRTRAEPALSNRHVEICRPVGMPSSR
jgi:transposase